MCEHEQTTVYTEGSLSFYDGEVVDTLHDVEVCLQCGSELPEPQEDNRDLFALILRLGKVRREWTLLTDKIYDEPNRENVEAMSKRSSDLLQEIYDLELKIDEMRSERDD